MKTQTTKKSTEEIDIEYIILGTQRPKQLMEKVAREEIRKIDSSLNYLSKLRPSSVFVYKVEKKGSIYVLKAAAGDYVWGIEHLDREAEILKRAKGVEGITHLVRKYGDTDNYTNPILKEFFDGKEIEDLEDKKISTKVQRKLERTVRDLHSLGVASLDVHSGNVILSSDGKDVCLVDLGYGQFSKEVDSSAFRAFKSNDLRCLEQLFN